MSISDLSFPNYSSGFQPAVPITIHNSVLFPRSNHLGSMQPKAESILENFIKSVPEVKLCTLELKFGDGLRLDSACTLDTQLNQAFNTCKATETGLMAAWKCNCEYQDGIASWNWDTCLRSLCQNSNGGQAVRNAREDMIAKFKEIATGCYSAYNAAAGISAGQPAEPTLTMTSSLVSPGTNPTMTTGSQSTNALSAPNTVSTDTTQSSSKATTTRPTSMSTSYVTTSLNATTSSTALETGTSEPTTESENSDSESSAPAARAQVKSLVALGALGLTVAAMGMF